MREYAEATGVGPVPETGPVLVPPTFAACFTVGRLGQVVEDPELGASWNLVHGSQAYEYFRPVSVGDALLCTPTITDITDRRRMELLTLQIDCSDADSGEPVLTSRASIIFFPSAGGEPGAG